MSFTATVKDEVSKINTSETENITELSAIICNSIINSDGIKITSENASVSRRIFSLIKDIYNITPKITIRRGYNYNKNMLYILEIKNNINMLIEDLGLKNSIPSEFIVGDNDLERAYLRGLFLLNGSINDPKTSMYHLEVIVDDYEYANFISEMMNHNLLKSKVLKRKNKYMVYIKEAEKIGDFLRIIKANNAVLYFEDMRIYRDHKNMINRLNNMEQANVDKMIMAANEQIKNIELIMKHGGLDLLNDNEREVATYRMKYKEASLLELSEIITYETGKRITKSGINHRIKKIKDLADRIREKEEN